MAMVVQTVRGRRKPLVTSDVVRDDHYVVVRLYPKRRFQKLAPVERMETLTAMAQVLETLAGQMREEAEEV